MDKIFLIVPFVFGATVGSFLNVCIHRIPLSISIVKPPSRCPSCFRRIPFYYNIPIMSYILLGGRCRFCGTSISVEYPLVEALTGGFLTVLFLKYGLTPPLFIYFIFTSILTIVTFIDLEHRIIPDVLSLPGIGLGFITSFFLPGTGVFGSLLGIIAGGGVLIIIGLAYHLVTGTEGMGGGDVKLLAMVGAFLGWKGVLLTLLAGSFAGAFVGVIVMALYGKTTKHALPFGPFLAMGAVFHLFYGEAFIAWYMLRAAFAPY